jgi:hypothetical protein
MTQRACGKAYRANSCLQKRWTVTAVKVGLLIEGALDRALLWGLAEKTPLV